LNVTADRTSPHLGAAKWDDEGVATEAFPVIERGQVVDYFTTRETAPFLATWYAKRNRPVKSHGSAVSWTPVLAPMGCASNLTVGTGSAGTTLESQVRQLSNGMLLRGADYVVSDQQVASGSFMPRMMYEVKNGQITRRLIGGCVQFATKNLWNGIAAMGDASTVQHYVHTGSVGETWSRTVLPVAAPSAQVSQVDVIQIGRNAS
jgi:predicted Zn-dependent protease